ncbi:MAG TPA: carboxypeptidase-like regulatory domain-containing protein [Longimicrobium sp.]
MLPRSILPAASASARRSWLIYLALLLQVAGGAAAAQTATVSVRDVGTGAPISGAMVRVEDTAGTVVRAGFTGADGTLQLRVRAGGYQVFIRRAGYFEETLPLQVQGSQASLAVRMRPRPFVLDTVVVLAPGFGDERGRDAFLRRSLTEDGVFLDPAYLTQRYHSTYLSDLLYGVPDLEVVSPACPVQRSSPRQRSIMRPRVAGRSQSPATGCATRLSPRKPVSTRGWGCFTTLLNGRPPEMGSFDAAYGHDEIDFWLRPRDIVGVEIYHVPSQIPRDLRQYSQPNCGIINYWTRTIW